MGLSAAHLNTLLTDLADLIDIEGVGPLEMLVCGGVAMLLQDLNNRTTRDVDVLGMWDANLIEIACIDEFPDNVKSCIRRIASRHPDWDLAGDNWINLGPRQLARQGLPSGYDRRLRSVSFGTNQALRLHLLSRVDLIPLKLYAAADRFSGRQEIHFNDLRRLHGTFEELDAGLNWVRTLSDFEEKRPEIQGVLERLGRDDLAIYV